MNHKQRVLKIRCLTNVGQCPFWRFDLSHVAVEIIFNRPSGHLLVIVFEGAPNGNLIDTKH